MHQPTEPVTPDMHYIPKHEDLPDVGELVYKKLEVPTEKIPAKTFFKDNPWDVMATSWHHLDHWGAMTKEGFIKDLEEATQHFANLANAENKVFRTYPITFEPEPRYGIGWLDWKGQSYRVDIRLFVAYETAIADQRYKDGEGNVLQLPGLRFHLTTLAEALDPEAYEYEEC